MVMVAAMVSTYSIGTSALASLARTQNQLTQLTAESSSGQYADLGQIRSQERQGALELQKAIMRTD